MTLTEVPISRLTRDLDFWMSALQRLQAATIIPRDTSLYQLKFFVTVQGSPS